MRSVVVLQNGWVRLSFDDGRAMHVSPKAAALTFEQLVGSPAVIPQRSEHPTRKGLHVIRRLLPEIGA